MKSVSDVIIQHIEPIQCVDIVPIPVEYEDIINRYMDFQLRYNFSTSEKYKRLTKLYVKALKQREMELGLRYTVWNDEIMREFENEFANTYIRPFSTF